MVFNIKSPCARTYLSNARSGPGYTGSYRIYLSDVYGLVTSPGQLDSRRDRVPLLIAVQWGGCLAMASAAS